MNNYKTKRPTKRSRKTVVRKNTSEPTLLVLFNKPFNTLSQFSGEPNDSTLSDFISIKDVYPAGRLDKDSEGLMLLTNNGKLQHKISSPKHKMEKCYWVQVEGVIDSQALEQLEKGVDLKDGRTRPAKAMRLEIDCQSMKLWPRNPPVRYRKEIPTSWLELTIKEGKNRQVRRMTAAVGFPTLRLIRKSIGPWQLDNLKPGQFETITIEN